MSTAAPPAPTAAALAVADEEEERQESVDVNVNASANGKVESDPDPLAMNPSNDQAPPPPPFSACNSADEALPPALRLMDDFDEENILLGLGRLLLCIQNINRGELKRNNWSLVIYDALHKLIHVKDVKVIEKLGVALLLSLKLVEEDPAQIPDKFTRYDDTLKKVLFTMEFSSELSQRKAWLPHLASFVEVMGHATLHWIDRIVSLLLSYTTSWDPQLWGQILLVVEVCIKNTWVKPSSSSWVEIISRISLLCNLSKRLKKTENESEMTEIETFETDDKDKTSQVESKVNDCFKLLMHCEDFQAVDEHLEGALEELMTRKLCSSNEDELVQTLKNLTNYSKNKL